MSSRSLPSTPFASRTPPSPSSPAVLSSPGGDLRLHQMIAVQGWGSLYHTPALFNLNFILFEFVFLLNCANTKHDVPLVCHLVTHLAG